ncbi:hypothetical protein ACXDF8_20870 [Mycolicibacterium sp. CBM1]
MTATQPRPRAVTVAFWSLLVAGVMLVAGGLIAATASIPAIFRGAGIVCALAGVMIGFLAGRVRRGVDARFRRATLALSLLLVVLVSLLSAFGVVHILVLLSVLPLVVGALFLSRPAAAGWFDADATGLDV